MIERLRPKSYLKKINFRFELCFHEENVFLILFNAHIHLIWSSLLYNLFIYSKHLYTGLCHSVSTFLNFSFIALGRHLAKVPVATTWCIWFQTTIYTDTSHFCHTVDESQTPSLVGHESCALNIYIQNSNKSTCN